MLRCMAMIVCRWEREGSVRKPERSRDYGLMGIVCREVVLSSAGEVLLGECDKATWNVFGLLRSMLPTG